MLLLWQISEFLGQEAALSVTLRDVASAAGKTFFDMLKARGDKLLRYPPPVAVDLSPPPAVAEGISALLELLNTYNGMMVPAGGKKPDFQPVMSAMLDPIIQVFLLCIFLKCFCQCPNMQIAYGKKIVSGSDV